MHKNPRRGLQNHFEIRTIKMMSELKKRFAGHQKVLTVSTE